MQGKGAGQDARAQDTGQGLSPRFRVGVLLMSPAMKDDSVCFRTVSFHILRIRLCGRGPHVKGVLSSDPPAPHAPLGTRTWVPV